MNLKKRSVNIIDTLEQKAPFLGVGLIAIFVFYVLFKGFSGRGDVQKGEQPVPEQRVPRPQLESENIQPPVGGGVSRPPVEQTAAVYKLSENLPSRAEMEFLAQGLGFTKDFEALDDTVHGRIFRWVGNSRTLTMPEDRRSFEFYHNFPLEFLESRNAPLPTEEDAKAVADSFLESQGLFNGFLQNADVSIRPLKLGIQTKDVVPWSDADVVEVDYSIYLDEIPLYIGNEPSTTAVLMWLGPGGEVLSLHYNFLGEPEEDLGEYPLKSTETILELLKDQEASVLRYGAPGRYDVAPSMEDLENVSVRNIRLIYFRKRQAQYYLQPMFMIEAESSISGIDVEIILLLPAVSEDFLD